MQPIVAHIGQSAQLKVAHGDSVLAVAPDTIEREILIDAPPRVVWSIVTEAEHLAGWFSDEAEIDLRSGGRMLLTWRGHGAYEGRVETVDPPRLTPHVFGAHVHVTLEAEELGTRLRVVESGFATLPWPDNARARYADENSKGWLTELDELRDYVARTVGANSDR